MLIHTETRWQLDGMGRYVKVYDNCYEYDGPTAFACGADKEQKQTEKQQSALFSQLTNQSQAVFGASNSVFQSLFKTFAPTIAAGPNQEGFSPALLASMKSQVITGTGQAYKNAKAAVGNASSAYGGGNTVLPSGAQIGTDLGLAEAGANQTSSQLNQLTQEDYAVGRENYKEAVTGLTNAPSVFNTATSAGNAAVGAGEATAKTANDIATADNSWISGVTGALGAVAGAATGSITGNLTKGLGGKQGAANVG